MPGKWIGRVLPLFTFGIVCSTSLAASPFSQNPQHPSEPVSETLAASLRGSGGGLQRRAALSDFFIDVFQVYSLPLSVSSASLEKTRTGGLLKLFVSNNSSEQILGIRYWLLVVDSDNKVRRAVDQSEGLKLNAYAAKAISLSAPSKLKIGTDDRVYLVLAQVIGRESIWEVRQARQALQDYVKGNSYAIPSVLRVLNQVDAPLGLSPIFLRTRP